MLFTHEGLTDGSLDPSMFLTIPTEINWPASLKKLIAAHDRAFDAWSSAETAQLEASAAYDKSEEADAALLVTALNADEPDPGTPHHDKAKRVCIVAETRARLAATAYNKAVPRDPRSPTRARRQPHQAGRDHRTQDHRRPSRSHAGSRGRRQGRRASDQRTRHSAELPRRKPQPRAGVSHRARRRRDRVATAIQDLTSTIGRRPRPPRGRHRATRARRRKRAQGPALNP